MPSASPYAPARPVPVPAAPGPVATVLPCLGHAKLFQDPLLDEPPVSGTRRAVRLRYATLTEQAAGLCRTCPLAVDCLYRAVVEYDVAGFVAGTTCAEREQIRRLLGVSVPPEDFDSLAGVSGRHRQVDHDEVIRLRRAHPQESLETLARRLGCSLSTVKRHLRQERRAAAEGDAGPALAPQGSRPGAAARVAGSGAGHAQPGRRLTRRVTTRRIARAARTGGLYGPSNLISQPLLSPCRPR